MNTIDPSKTQFNTIILHLDETGITSTTDAIIPPGIQPCPQGFSMRIVLPPPKPSDDDQGELDNFAESLSSPTATASLGAALMELSVTFAAEMRKENAERRNLETQSIIEQLNNQADIIKSKGTWQMILGAATAVVSGVAGGMSFASTGKTLAKGVGEGEKELAKDADKAIDKSEEALASSKELDDAIIDGEDGIEMTDVGEWSSKETKLDDVDCAVVDGEDGIEMTDASTWSSKETSLDDVEGTIADGDEVVAADLDDVEVEGGNAEASEQAGVLPNKEKEILEKFTESTKVHLLAQMINQFHSSVTGGINSTSGGLTAMKESEVKTDDAVIESFRSLAESQKSLEENLKELLQKALSTQQAIADNINQTRAKILG